MSGATMACSRCGNRAWTSETEPTFVVHSCVTCGAVRYEDREQTSWVARERPSDEEASRWMRARIEMTLDLASRTSVRHAARAMGVSVNTIGNWRKASSESVNVSVSARKRKQPSSASIRRQGLQMLADGSTVREVADALGFEVRSVKSWKSRHEYGAKAHYRRGGEERAAALLKIANGARVKDVAAELGVSPSTVQRWRVEAREDGALIPSRAYNLHSDETYEAAFALRKRGYTHQEVSEELGVPWRTVSTWLHGVISGRRR